MATKRKFKRDYIILEAKDMNLDIATEFLVMASTLLLIKSVKMLNNHFSLFPKDSSVINYNKMPFFFKSSRAVSTESTPVLFFIGANSRSRTTSKGRQLSSS